MLQCIFLAALLASGYSWTLRSNHDNVIPKLTYDVILHCFYMGSDRPVQISDRLTEIQILRMDSTNAWKTYAQVISNDTSKVVLTEPSVPGMAASGHLGQASDTFLTITWSTSFYNALGSYKCVVDGFSGESVESNVVKLTNSRDPKKDMLDAVITMREEFDSLAEEFNISKQEHHNCVQKTTEMEKVLSLAAQTMNEMRKEINALKDESSSQHQDGNAVMMQMMQSSEERMKKDMAMEIEALENKLNTETQNLNEKITRMGGIKTTDLSNKLKALEMKVKIQHNSLKAKLETLKQTQSSWQPYKRNTWRQYNTDWLQSQSGLPR